MRSKDPVYVVGAGVAGLCCALDLAQAGLAVKLLEASDAPGGRVRTDEVDGFRLDRGFQVWLEAYPECRRRLDPASLRPGAFASGAVLFDGEELRRFPDPARHPRLALEAVAHPVAGVRDKWRLRRLRSELRHRAVDALFEGEEMSTRELWRRHGLSDRMVEGFLNPFFRGIFLQEPEQVSRRMFDFVTAMFSRGRALLPNAGIGAIPEFLTSELPAGVLECGVRVERVRRHAVWTGEGKELPARAVVLAVDDPAALGFQVGETPSETAGTTCLYFDAGAAPVEGPWLVLNASGRGRVNQVSVNSNVVAGLAPRGRHLIAVSIPGVSELDTTTLVREVTDELMQWFGTPVEGWRFLNDYRIAHALPAFPPGQLPGPGCVEEEGVLLCGDRYFHPSLQGAMASGGRAARRLRERLGL